MDGFANTEQFRTWFQQSKVVAPSDQPLVVYHGTTSSFAAFDDRYLESRSRCVTALLGHFFSVDPRIAEDSIPSNGFIMYGNKVLARRFPDGGNIIPAYLSIQNPFVEKADILWPRLLHRERLQAFLPEIKAKGHDGLRVIGTGKDISRDGDWAVDNWVAFNSNQIMFKYAPFLNSRPAIATRSDKSKSCGNG